MTASSAKPEKPFNGGQWTAARINMKKTNQPSVKQIKTLFSYNPDTGVVTRVGPTIRSNGRPYIDKRNIGSSNGKGYRRFSITCVGFSGDILGHKIAWAIFYGTWPDGCIDHINGKRDDNRISNLRILSNRDNQTNRHVKVGRDQDLPIGVYRTARKGRPGIWYAVKCEYEGIVKSTYRRSAESAIKARQQYEQELFPIKATQWRRVVRCEKTVVHHVGSSPRPMAAEVRIDKQRICA
jgi:hypothetical protein